MNIFFNLLYLVPKNLLSRFVGTLVSTRLFYPLDRLSVRWFARRYKINMSEAEFSIDQYKTIQALFTRHLKQGVRPISETELIHPVDSELTVSQRIVQDTLIQAKGKVFSVGDFLNRPNEKNLFEGGTAHTYYLCPTDYHRVHSPVSGQITGIDYIPGPLWPVNEWSVQNVKNLFSVNERVVIWISTARGKLAYVMVGATNVGKMTLSFDADVVTNKASSIKHGPIQKQYSKPISIQKGEELGVFNMGSTVIVLYDSSFFKDPQVVPQKVKLGEPITAEMNTLN